MIYLGIIEAGSEIWNWLQVLAPALLVIIAIILTASVTKGYRGFISGVAEILKSKYSLLFFIVVLFALIYFWQQFKEVIGW
jgi:hypothetical protein